jgi:hypothetical protein
MHLLEQLLAQRMHLQQMVEAQHRGFIQYRHLATLALRMLLCV